MSLPISSLRKFAHGSIGVFVVAAFAACGADGGDRDEITATNAAALVAPSTFDAADGNQSVEAGETDWATFVNSQALTIADDSATGAADTSFGGGTKEDSAVPKVVTGSIPNNKSDLLEFYVAAETVSGTPFMYLGWVRANTLGTANIDFEFNKSTTLSSNGVTPVRTAGDVLFTFDFSQGGNTVNLRMATWRTTGNAATDCEASSKLPCWSKLTALTGAEASVNLASISNLVGGGLATSATLPELTFGEAAIDLTNIVDLTQCSPFASAYAKSRSSDSFTSELKDFIPPHGLNLGSCGVNIHKQDDSASSSALQGAVFTLYKDVGGAGNLGDGVCNATDSAGTAVATCTTDAAGNCTMSPTALGNYCVFETTTPGGYATAPPQAISLTTDVKNVSLTFTDPRLFKVLTFVCSQSDNKLYSASVTLDGVTKTSAGSLSGIDEATLCALLSGAAFADKTAGSHPGNVTIQ